jgi:hypothetical protein
MARVRCTAVQARPTACLALTCLTLDELQPLVPPFAAALQGHMAAWRLAGQPPPARQCTGSQHCP